MSTIDKVATGAKSELSKKAKADLLKFAAKVDSKLDYYLDKEIRSVFSVGRRHKKLSTLILKHIKEHNLRPAKRIRASFVFYAYKLLGGVREKEILKASMSVELVHTALLMHDDFMDQDKIRRGLPTTHEYFKSYHKANGYLGNFEHFGNSMSVNAGDLALSKGYQILAQCNFKPTLKIKALTNLLESISKTALGQAYDMVLESSGKASISDVINLHHAKTAIYTCQSPLHVGAILAGANRYDLDVISKYAIPVGIAFQLQDDVLGLFGDVSKTGKSSHSDAKQGKITLLYIKALQNAKGNDLVDLKKLYGKKHLTSRQVKRIREIVIKTGSLQYSKTTSVKWAKKAQKAISTMAKRGWNKRAINFLSGIAQYMVERQV